MASALPRFTRFLSSTLRLISGTRRRSNGGNWGFAPAYCRGELDLARRKGVEAATEFQKILDHRGWDPLSVEYPAAYLGLARAIALTGDLAKSRQAYQDLFAVWKDADADLPVLAEARREYEKVRLAN